MTKQQFNQAARKPHPVGNSRREARVFFQAIVCFIALAFGMALATGQSASPSQVGIRIPAGQRLLFTARGEGVQIYESEAKANDPQAFEWTLKGPDATLFDTAGRKIGKHYEGPTWEALDGSKVKGKRISSAPSPRPGAVPWLLLKADSASGQGIIGDTSYIVRVETDGGMPKGAPMRAGQEVRIKYRATYIFLGAAQGDVQLAHRIDASGSGGTR